MGADDRRFVRIFKCVYLRAALYSGDGALGIGAHTLVRFLGAGTMSGVELVVDCKNVLGEGVTWDHTAQRLNRIVASGDVAVRKS